VSNQFVDALGTCVRHMALCVVSFASCASYYRIISALICCQTTSNYTREKNDKQFHAPRHDVQGFRRIIQEPLKTRGEIACIVQSTPLHQLRPKVSEQKQSCEWQPAKQHDRYNSHDLRTCILTLMDRRA
jgi:hypothetical protein